MFECVINISEGRDEKVLDTLSANAGASLRDRHADRFHNRAVFTLIDEPEVLVASVHSLIHAAYEALDLTRHAGVHPRFGVVDVVPFVALDAREERRAVHLRDETAEWISDAFGVPTFLYGPLADGSLRTLPDVRRLAFRGLTPDFGPPSAAPTRGASAVGARPILVAWNLWLEGTTLERARAIASSVRGPSVRSMAFEVGDHVQVSCNLLDVARVRASVVYDQVAGQLVDGERLSRAEVVGLVPESLLRAEDPARLQQLGLDPSATIEARL